MYDSYATSDYIAGVDTEQEPNEIMDILKRYLPSNLAYLDAVSTSGRGDGQREIDTFLQVWRHNQQALSSWRPDGTRVSSDILLFKATQPFPAELAEAVGFTPTEPESWHKFTTGNLSVEFVDANHYTLFDDPDISEKMAVNTAQFISTDSHHTQPNSAAQHLVRAESEANT